MSEEVFQEADNPCSTALQNMLNWKLLQDQEKTKKLLEKDL